MKRFICMLVCVLGCSSGSLDVEPDTSGFNAGDNSNVQCVVGDVSYSCTVNNWTYADNYGTQRSCSNYGTCVNNATCTMWNGDIGFCKSVK